MSSVFDLNCTVLGQGSVTGILSKASSVEQVKKWVFNQSPSLFALSRDQFRIAITSNRDSIIEDESILFHNAHPSIKEAIKTETVVNIHLLSLDPNFGTTIPQRPRTRTGLNRRNAGLIPSFNNAQKEGHLTKRGNSYKSWKRRWCILQNNFIFYFRKKSDTHPLGAVPIQDCLYCGLYPYSGRRFCFSVHTRSRVYFMTGQSLRESNEWISIINQCMNALGIVPMDPKEVEATKVMHISSVKSGFLYKTGKDIKSGWKKRYFRMKDSFIYYFKTKKSSSPCGYIPLQDAKFIIPKDNQLPRKYYFQVKTQHRLYHLAAEDKESLLEWEDVIQKFLIAEEFKEEAAGNSPRDALITLHNPDSFWSKIEKTNFQVPIRLKEFFASIYDEFKWLLIRNEEYFGPLPESTPEQDCFFAITYMRLYSIFHSTKRSPFIPVEFTTIPLPISDESFPVYFKSIGSEGDVTSRCSSKSVFCDANTTIRDAIIKFLDKKSKITSPVMKQADLTLRFTKKRSGSNLGKGRILQFGDESSPDHYIARISGIYEYIEDSSITMGSIRYVHECLKRNHKIKFTLEERNMKQIPEINNMVKRAKPKFEHEVRECIPSQAVTREFAIKILVVENTEIFDATLQEMRSDGSTVQLFLESFVLYGTEMIGTIMRTQRRNNTLFADILCNDLDICELPRQAKLQCTLVARSEDGDTILAAVQMQLFDYFGCLLTGSHKVPMYTKIPTVEGSTPAELVIEFIKSPLPIVHIPYTPLRNLMDPLPPTPEEVETLEGILFYHPLQWLKEHEKKTVWLHRVFIMKNYPRCLPALLTSVKWISPKQVQEIHSLLLKWPILSPTCALRLLDVNYPDVKVRQFAINCLDKLSDAELPLYLLQLVQVIKYETYHISPLVIFLLKRSIQEPDVIGHELFWFLKAELDIDPHNIRFRIILEQFMLLHGPKTHGFFRQCDLVNALKTVAYKVRDAKPSKRDEVLKKELSSLYFPVGSILPINPSVHIRGLIIEKCKWLDSFTVPLWLVFENYDSDEDPIYVIFKAGDDLRQDALTVQMLQLMDNIWRNEGLDMHLTPYRVVATGKNCGLIEVVLNAETTANIQKMAGGATAVFSLKPLTNWLIEHNKFEQNYEKAVENFMFSMAGYCVATYVLGIGDRHNDNIMVTKEGHLFHIDFAHFLGNVMKFYGFKRERAPFVLTPDFANVIGGKESPRWNEFVELCCKSFNIMRKYSSTFISLFMLMISSGIPQLTCSEDLYYLIDSFCVGKSDKESKNIFTGLIQESLNTKATQLNFAIHILAHRD